MAFKNINRVYQYNESLLSLLGEDYLFKNIYFETSEEFLNFEYEKELMINETLNRVDEDKKRNTHTYPILEGGDGQVLLSQNANPSYSFLFNDTSLDEESTIVQSTDFHLTTDLGDGECLKIGETFTLKESITLRGVQFLLQRRGTDDTMAIKAQLYKSEGSMGYTAIPTESVLVESEPILQKNLSQDSTWVQFDFKTLYLASKGNYSVVLSSEGESEQNNVIVALGKHNAIKSINKVSYSSSEGWTPDSTLDVNFKVLSVTNIVKDELKTFLTEEKISFLNPNNGFLGAEPMGYNFVTFEPNPKLKEPATRPVYPGYDPIYYHKLTDEDLSNYIYSTIYPNDDIPIFHNFKIGNFVIDGTKYNPVYDIRNYRLEGGYEFDIGDKNVFKSDLLFNRDERLVLGSYIKLGDKKFKINKRIHEFAPVKTSVYNKKIQYVVGSQYEFSLIPNDIYNFLDTYTPV